MSGDAQVRTGTLLVGMLKTPGLRNVLLSISKQFDRIKVEKSADRLARIVAGSPEDGQAASDGSGAKGAEPGEAGGAIAPAAMGRQDALKRYALNLTERARNGQLDPVAGCGEEIRQIVDILMRRRQNNPRTVISRTSSTD